MKISTEFLTNSNTNTNQRILSIDFLRALACFYIVGIHNLTNAYYLPVIFRYLPSPNFFIKLDRMLAYIFVGIFIYLSGFMLAKKYSDLNTIQDIWGFIKKRFLRIYPLYILTLLLFLFCSMIGFRLFTLHLFLLNLFLNTSEPTLWFISLIWLYYLLFPLFSYRYNIIKLIILTSLVCALLIGANLAFSIIDFRLVMYMPIFIIGIVTARHERFLALMMNKKIIPLLGIMSYGLAYMYFNFYDQTPKVVIRKFFLTISIMASIFPLLVLAEKIVHNLAHKAIILNLSYASFCMYLFHRIVFYSILKIYYPDSIPIRLLYLMIVGVPLTCFLSGKIQKGYDSLLEVSYKKLS